MIIRPAPGHQPPASSPVLDAGAAERDSALVQRTLRGDREAFDELVHRYQKVLFNLALRMVGDDDDAQDIVQASFLNAYQKLGTFDRSRRFFSWIYRIAMNQSLNLLERRKGHEPLSVDLVAEEEGPVERLDAARWSRRIQRALLEIPPDYRQVIILRHFLELSYAEMAELIGIETKTVKSRLFTARRRLADLLLPEDGSR